MQASNNGKGVTSIKLGSKYQPNYQMLHALAHDPLSNYQFGIIPDGLKPVIKNFSLATFDSKVKNGVPLTFEDSFAGMMYVVAATNNLIRQKVFPGMSFEEAIAKGTYFLTVMATKEAFVGLTPTEVAGLTAAGLTDVVCFPICESAVETSGMGADRGWGTKEVKTINASTLSALAMASMGHTAMKHGSYGNTTKVGSTDVLENFGAKITQDSLGEVEILMQATNFWFSDAHAVKTLHYLSHLLMVETINHVVGPMTPPINAKLYKVMGVNHHVHPAIVAQAYVILHQKGFVNLGGVVVVGGVDQFPTPKQALDSVWFKEHSFLDELSTDATLIAMATGDQYLGVEVLEGLEPFGTRMDQHHIKVRNTVETLMRANEQAIRGKGYLGEYLACNVALCMLATQLEGGAYCDGDTLTANTSKAVEVLQSERTLQTLNNYVRESGGERINWT